MQSIKIKLLLLSLMHFATDGLCAYLIFSRLYPDNPTLAVLVFLGYNTLAFVTQSPVGLVADKYPKYKLMLTVSVLSLALGYLFSGVCLVAVFFIGMGNSIFHVAGGKYVTDKSGNDISHLGIFVSTGAIGLALGQRYAHSLPLVLSFFGIIVICLLLMLVSEDEEKKHYQEEYDADINGKKIALLAIVGVVFARSFVGTIVSPSFTRGEYTFIVLALATALGKAVGGVVSKLVGTDKAAIVSMSAAAALLTLGTGNPVTFALGVFAFNFTMPMTLYYANVVLKGKEGFAFGTLAAFLVPGSFIAEYFGYTVVFKVVTALLCAASIAVILYVTRRTKTNGSACTDDNP